MKPGHTLIQSILDQISPFPKEYLNQFIDLAERKNFQKGTVLCRQGEVETCLYFVESGVQRVFVEAERMDYNLLFSYSPTFTGSPDSIFSGQPSLFHVDCLTDSVLWRVPAKIFQELSLESDSFRYWKMNLIEAVLYGRLQREVEMATLNAEQRYAQFRKRSPHLFNLISNKHMASYLQMTPETFSRVHKKFFESS